MTIADVSPTRRAALLAAEQAALAAWRAIEPLYLGRYRIDDKHDGPTTEADRLADRVIMDMLAAAWPESGAGFLTEESEDDPTRRGRDRLWIIDPIDGTREFIERNGNFAIHIGLVERNGEQWEPTVGVVYRPAASRLYCAVRGSGAWCCEVICRGDGEPALGEPVRLHVSDRLRLEQCRSVVSQSHRTSRLMRFIDSLPLERHWSIGSLGVKLCLIAEGQAELYVNLAMGKTKEWDTCAPHLILDEAGGRLTDLTGAPLTYNQLDVRHPKGLLATNGLVHEELVRRVQSFLSEHPA